MPLCKGQLKVEFALLGRPGMDDALVLFEYVAVLLECAARALLRAQLSCARAGPLSCTHQQCINLLQLGPVHRGAVMCGQVAKAWTSHS